MESKNGLGHAYCVRNVEDGQTVPLTGDGEFCIGLTLDESIACSNRNGSSASPQGNEDNDIVVPLVMLTVWKTSGVTVSPASRDLRCWLNGVDIGMETNIIPGNRIEVGDKVLELLEGSTAKPSRRHLPPTPGVPILPTPPPKPQRATGQVKAAPIEIVKDPHRHALREWCLEELPNSEHELIKQAKDPEQLACLASSYLTKHINLHTDVVMSAELTDRIFKMMQEVAHHRRDILRRFLSEVLRSVTDDDDDMEKKKEDNHHVTVTMLLVEILRQFLDPGYLVLLCLQLLRALSHIPGNVRTMVTSLTPSAVLGSMSAYKDDERVQNNCLDILAKMATYVPAVLEKPPMRESCIDLVTMAMTLHSNNIMIIQAAIRTLANLGSTLHSLAFAAMIASPYEELRAYVSLVINVLEYLYNTTQPNVRNALGIFHTDLTVKTDGRRFLFEYGKMEQLKRQQKLWELQPDVPPRLPTAEDDVIDGDDLNHVEEEEEEEDCTGENGQENISEEEDSWGKYGILKKSRSFENLRNPDRRVSFVTEEDLVSSTSSSGANSPTNGTSQTGGAEGPDIQVLSRSRIYPTKLTSGDSTEDASTDTQISDSENKDNVTAPQKPVRRPIGAPLVHINSQSDSDADAHVESPTENEHQKNSVNQSLNCDNNILISDLHITKAAPYDGNISLSHSSSELSSDNVRKSSPLSSKSQHSRSPVDLTNFRYSAADVVFMKRLMSVQVTCHVCSASVRGRDPQALKLIDMPLGQLLSRAGIPNAVWQFAESQYEQDATLMDVDPSTVISVIDAVRYKMLAFDLVSKSLQVLVQSLSSKLHPKMFAVTGEVITSVIRDTALSPIVTDQEFVKGMENELEKVKSNVRDPVPITTLIDDLGLRFQSKQQEQQQ